MLSEASIASWCSPSQASPSYTPSRRRLRLRHWCSPKQISLVQTPRAEISRLALAGGSMLLQNLASSLIKVLYDAIGVGAGLSGSAVVRVLPARTGRRRSALYGMPPAAGRRQNSFEFYGEPQGGIRHPKPSAASRRDSEQDSRTTGYRSTPSNSFTTAAKGCPRANRARQLQAKGLPHTPC